MERQVENLFAGIYRQRQEHYDSLFYQARRLNRRLSLEEIQEHLNTTIAPIINAIAGEPEEKVIEVCDILYDISLDLFSHSCLGSRKRYPMIIDLWKWLPQIPDLLVAAPRKLVASLSNAIYHLSVEANAKEELWLTALKKLAPMCTDVKNFLKAGQVIAWRCGLSQYRKDALVLCEDLPSQLLVEIFNVGRKTTEGQMMKMLHGLVKNPWYVPEKNKEEKLVITYKVGGFRGYGGPFVTPPKAKCIDERLFLYDKENYWGLYADAFGATLHRAGKGKLLGRSTSVRSFNIDASGKVTKNKQTSNFGILKESSSFASTANTLVVTLPYSHYVYLVAETNDC